MSYKDARYYEGRYYQAPFHGQPALVPFPPTVPPPFPGTGGKFKTLIGPANQILLGVFAEELTYTPAGAAAFSVTAIVSNSEEQGVYKVLWIDPADMPSNPTKNDAVEVDGLDCVVRGEPDLAQQYGLWRVPVRIR